MGAKLKVRFRKPVSGMLYVRQVPRLSIAFRTWWMQERERWDYLGERVGLEGLVNAMVADFMGRPPAERIAFMDRAIPKAEQLEREWIADLERRISAGEVEPEYPHKPIRPAQPAPAPVSHSKDVGGKAGRKKA